MPVPREEDQAYRDKTGYEIPEDLQFKQDRLAKIQAAKQALEAQLNPGKAIEGSAKSIPDRVDIDERPEVANQHKHLTLQTRTTRLARKSICFSKLEKMYDIVIGLFINRFEFGFLA